MTVKASVQRGGAEERILATAAGLFASFGYKGVSTRDIATGAGVNEVTIYRHYPRKRDLYIAVLEAELQHVKLRGDLLARIAEASDGKMALERTLELITTTLMQRPDLLRLMQYSALEVGQDVSPLLRRYLGELVEVIARYLEPWTGQAELREANAKAVVLTLTAIVVNFGPLHQLFLNARSSPESILNAYMDFCNILNHRNGASDGRDGG